MSVYTLLAEGFETIEALAVVDVLKRAGLNTVLVSLDGKPVTSAHGVTVMADIAPEAVPFEDIELLNLPGGGGGVERLKACPAVCALICRCAEAGLPIAAICAAPALVAELGLLRGRRAVCYPGCEQALTDGGADFQPGLRVVRDGAFITGQAAGSSIEFGLALVELLRGQAAADRIAQAIYMLPINPCVL